MLKKSYLGLISVAISLIGCTTTPKPNTIYPITEDYNSPKYSNISSSILFEGISDNWHFVDSKYLNGTKIYIYVKNTDNNYFWHEKIEISHTLVTPLSTVNTYYNQIIKPEVKDQCYYESPNFRILQQSNYDLIFAYTMKNCGKNDDQTVVGRIMRAPQSISTITYAVKDDPLATPEDQMLTLVSTAKIIKD